MDVHDLADAYTTWDAACTRISDAAQTAIDNGNRPPRLGANTLAADTERLQHIEQTLGLPVGWDTPIRTLRDQMPLGLAVIMAAGRARPHLVLGEDLVTDDQHHD